MTGVACRARSAKQTSGTSCLSSENTHGKYNQENDVIIYTASELNDTLDRDLDQNEQCSHAPADGRED